MTQIDVLTVCGAGVVSSTMIAEKMKVALKEYGYDVHAVETNTGGVQDSLSGGHFDFIAYVSPVTGEYDIPVINAIGFFTGFGEEEFIKEVLDVLKKIGK